MSTIAINARIDSKDKERAQNIFNKLGCSNRTDAIIKGLKQGYIDLNDIQ